MTFATYAPPIKVHPDRYGAVKSNPNRLFVLHTTEGGEGDDQAEASAARMTKPGDRQGTSGPYGSSYQYIVDTDRIIPAVPENVVSYSAPGANNDGIHIVFPGRAGQTRAQWLDTISSKCIDMCARLLVDRSRALGIPTTQLTVAQIKAGARGLCDHNDISQAYGRTDHWDVGPDFPWNELEARIAALTTTNPQPEDDMKMGKARIKGYQDQFLMVPLTAGSNERISAEDQAPIIVTSTMSRAQLEAELGYPLSPLVGENQ